MPVETQPPNAASSGFYSRKTMTLNIYTSKFHALGDYVHTIQMFGCTDLYSTQLVWNQHYTTELNTHGYAQGELLHWLVKRLYGRTNNRHATKQIGQHIQRLERANIADPEHLKKRMPSELWSSISNDPVEVDQNHGLDVRYRISNSCNDSINMYSFLYAYEGNPGFDVSLSPDLCIV